MTVSIRLLGAGRTEVVHDATGHAIRTDMSPAFGGGGSTFSSTDLVAAALGSCIASSIDGVLVRAGVDVSHVAITVDKHLSDAPRRIERLEVRIEVRHLRTERLQKTLERAAAACAVHRSLSSEVTVQVRFST